MKSVTVLSKWDNSHNVALVVDRLRARSLRPVLISPFSNDRNRDKCDDHVVFDWDSEELSTLISQLDQRGIEPIAAVTMVEPLIPWQIAVAAHYGLPGAGAGRNVLASKLLVREHMRTLGLSTVRFWAEPDEVDLFPAIVKPTRVTSASWRVRRVDSPAELAAYRRHLAEEGLAEIELIFEEYLPGTEFSVDGPVVEGRFHPVLAVEKPDHDEVRHHDAGLLIHPPQQDHVRRGVRVLSEAIDTLCADLDLDQLWLHVEGRATENGRTELVEINPRPGGGTYPAVTRHTRGIDPIEAFISMSLGEFTFTPTQLDPVRESPIVGMVDLEAFELGTVEVDTTEDDLRALPGVITVKIVNNFQISTLEMENSFLGFAVTAESVSQLRARAAAVLSTLDYRVTARP